MHFQSQTFAGLVAIALWAPIGAQAQFTPSPYHYFEVRGPNSINFPVGAGVAVGAVGPNGISGTANRNPAEACAAPLTLSLFNLAPFNIPVETQGRYVVQSFSSICTGAWSLTLTSPVGQQALATTPTLVGARLLPFVSNNNLTSTADGKIHTFSWFGVAGIGGVRVNILDRSLLPGGGVARLVRSLNFSGTTTSFVLDLNQPSTPYFNDRPYTLEVSLIETRDGSPVVANNFNVLSRSRTYFDFTLPAAPLTTAPVFLPIVEYGANGQGYQDRAGWA